MCLFFFLISSFFLIVFFLLGAAHDNDREMAINECSFRLHLAFLFLPPLFLFPFGCRDPGLSTLGYRTGCDLICLFMW